MKSYKVTLEVKFEATDADEAREYVREISEHIFDSAYEVNGSAIAELT